MLKKPKDPEQMQAEIDQMITAIELPELNKQSMRARWLDQVIWMERRALDALWWYRVLRLRLLAA